MQSAFLYGQQTSAMDSLFFEARESMYEATNAWTEEDLQNARAKFERLLNVAPYPCYIHYYIAYADYNLAHFYHSGKNDEMLSRALDDGISHLEKAMELKTDFADAAALLSALLGEKISVSPWKAMILGMQSGSAMKKAVEIEPGNPRIYYLDGAGAYFTPKLFGGGKDKARTALTKAAQLFREYKSPSALLPDWGERETWAWLGVIAADADSLDLAKTYYEKALSVDPEYNWVKYRLLPGLEKRTTNDF
jgi:tetratricopeptide (TPR) repeat protein